MKGKHDHPPEFFTIAVNEPIPDKAKVVLRPGQVGTPIQVKEHGDDHDHFKYLVVEPGSKLPSGKNVKIIDLATRTTRTSDVADHSILFNSIENSTFF